MTIKRWLKADYPDYLEIINQVEARWKAEGSKERRNWWDVFAGGTDGAPLVIAGQQFPVLRSAQIRKGVPVTSNAECRNENEVPPPFRFGRWQKRRMPTKARKSARATSATKSTKSTKSTKTRERRVG